jgi:hypothetical protein
MRWSYADDYGLGLDFCDNGRMLGQASFVWGTALTGRAPGGNFPDELRSELLAGNVLTGRAIEEIQQVLADVTAGSVSGSTVRDRIAAILDLAAFAWLSPEICVREGLEELREEYPDAEDIELS